MWWHRINTARRLCAGDGFSNKYSPGVGRHNSFDFSQCYAGFTIVTGLILSVFVMSALARALGTARRELAVPALSMGSTDMKKKQEAERKYCVCFTGLQTYTD